MYETQFFLKRRPFAATPDPRCFLASGPIQGALDELVVCVEQGQGIAVVSAPAGTGKTLLCERLRMELEARFEIVLLRHASFLTRRSLLQTILADLNHSYRRHDEQELRLELIPAIRALNPRREALVLVCDEAHMLNEDLLEELRMLSDLADQGRPLVRLVLVGQLGLEETLARPGLEAINQRIRAHVCLETFDRAASADYIDYRITWAGGRLEEVFAPEALELIVRASEGVPRCINQLCDHALLLAYVAEQKPVSGETVREALQDLRQLPLHWNESLLGEGSDVAGSFDDCDSIATTPTLEAPTTPSLGTGDPAAIQFVEFGADLPPVEPVETLADVGDFDIDEISAEDLADEPEEDPVGSSTSFPIESPEINRTICQNVSAPAAIYRPGEVVEELVCDRYAAIDGGFAVPEVSANVTRPSRAALAHDDSAFPKSSEEKLDTENSTQFVVKHVATEISTEHTLTVSATVFVEQPDTNGIATAAASAPVGDEGFEAVCARLDDMLPEVPENPGWDADGLMPISDAATTETPCLETIESSPASVAALDDWDSIEQELVASIYAMTNEIHTEIQSSRSGAAAAESSQELAVRPPQTLGVEIGAEGIEVSQNAYSEASHRDSMYDSSSRPYRNLFSRLRRKQQGLL